jgi:Ser/Thr protein kinase RdoA (MazF antagonist)
VTSALEAQVERILETLRAAGSSAAVEGRFGGADAWLLVTGSAHLVLKRGRPEQDEADVTWEHDHLRRLQETGFPAPAPIPAFDGESWTRLGDRIWAALTYLPGRTLASEPDPDMEAAGAFLARYHRAARQVPVKRQRPTAAGLARLRQVTPWDRLRAALETTESLGLYARLLDDLEAGLRDLQYESLEHLVVHGDATNDNLIVDGAPPRIVGFIDFGSSHLAPWPADIAAALWRSGRGIDTDVGLEPDRVTRFVRGYHRESQIPRNLARAVPLLIQARGLQLISRRVRRHPPGQPVPVFPDVALTLARTSWVHDHRQDLIAAVEDALDARVVPPTGRDDGG